MNHFKFTVLKIICGGSSCRLSLQPDTKKGDPSEPGHQDFTDLCSPFMQAMTVSKDCLYGMLLNGKYMFAVLSRSNLRYRADHAKWAAEGIFEFVRRWNSPSVQAAFIAIISAQIFRSVSGCTAAVVVLSNLSPNGRIPVTVLGIKKLQELDR